MTLETKSKLKVGSSIINILSKSFYTKKRMIFDELVTNAYDAGSTKVSLDFKDNEIIIEDNGMGMTQEQLKDFFSIGDSSKKEDGEVSVSGKPRKTIGKFGIGKLSMRQICDRFLIITRTENGELLESEFNFLKLEESRFIEDFELIVKKSKEELKRGTKKILKDITEDKINEELISEVKSGLSKTMPLSSEFELKINNQKISPFDYVSSYEPIETELNEKVETVGKVSGKVYFTKIPMKNDESGVFIKVKGRIVNADHGRIIDFSRLTHSAYLARRILAVLEIDSLEEAILSNRSGFSTDNQKYLTLLVWLKKVLNKIGDSVYKEYKKEIQKNQEDEIRNNLVIPLKEAIQELGVTIKDNNFWESLSLDITDLGEEKPECFLDEKEYKITFNSSHPSYIFAQEKDSLPFHCLKASAVVLSIYFTQKEKKDFPVSIFYENYEHIIRKLEEGSSAVAKLMLFNQIQNIEEKKTKLIEQVIQIADEINHITKKEIIKILPADILRISQECETKEAFNFFIQRLNSWIESMDTSYFEEIISKEKMLNERGDKKRSIGLVEEYLAARGKSRTIAIILRDVEKLSAGIARHVGERLKKDLNAILIKYTIDSINPNYSIFFVKILWEFERFLEELYGTIKK